MPLLVQPTQTPSALAVFKSGAVDLAEIGNHRVLNTIVSENVQVEDRGLYASGHAFWKEAVLALPLLPITNRTRGRSWWGHRPKAAFLFSALSLSIMCGRWIFGRFSMNHSSPCYLMQ